MSNIRTSLKRFIITEVREDEPKTPKTPYDILGVLAFEPTPSTPPSSGSTSSPLSSGTGERAPDFKKFPHEYISPRDEILNSRYSKHIRNPGSNSPLNIRIGFNAIFDKPPKTPKTPPLKLDRATLNKISNKPTAFRSE